MWLFPCGGAILALIALQFTVVLSSAESESQAKDAAAQFNSEDLCGTDPTRCGANELGRGPVDSAISGQTDSMDTLQADAAEAAKCRVSWLDWWKGRSVHVAARDGNVAAVRHFLRTDPGSVKICDSEGWTPLHHAALDGHALICIVLVAAGADPNAKLDDGSTALMLAAREGHMKICRKLLKAGAAVAAQNSQGATALHAAAEAGHADICNLLVAAGASPNAQKNDGWTALHLSAGKNRVQTLRQLLAANANVILQDNEGAAPLHIAAANGHAEMVVALLEANAPRKLRNNRGETALDLAESAFCIKFDVVKALKTAVSSSSVHPFEDTPGGSETDSRILQDWLCSSIFHRLYIKADLMKTRILEDIKDVNKIVTKRSEDLTVWVEVNHIVHWLIAVFLALVVFLACTDRKQEVVGVQRPPGLAATDESLKEINTLHFVLKQKPANLDAFRGTSYMGNIKPDAKVCWVSFPGKFQAGWEALIHERNEDSVACVFLTDPESGLGQHHFPYPNNREQCLCAELYGQRDYETFGYLIAKEPSTDKEKKELVQTAHAMNAHLVFGNPTEEDRTKAKELWKRNKKRAAWGCMWFKVWLRRVEKAVGLKQRLKVVYFPGQVGCGKIPWNMLAIKDPWDGIGCGGSQKGEIAKLDQMRHEHPTGGWEYDEVDVTRFLSKQFTVGETVDALDPDGGSNSFVKAVILEVPRDDMTDVKWQVRCLKTQKEFETKLVRHTTDFFEQLLVNCGGDALKTIFENVLKLTVDTIKEKRLENGTASLAVTIDIRTIEQAQGLRDLVLDDYMVEEINTCLADRHQIQEEISLHKEDFLNHYTRQLMTLSELTAHQKNKLKELNAHPNDDIHLRGPAGSGKTFVALGYVLEKLKSGFEDVLYVCPSGPLTFHFLQWLLIHAERTLPNVSAEKLLRRVWVKPDDHYFMHIEIQNSCIVLQEVRNNDSDFDEDDRNFDLAVFDEAHELLRTKRWLVGKIKARRKILMSDVSQSSVVQIEYPKMREVTLTEVVRSSKRLVLGARAFALQDTHPITSLGTTGPPLKSFLFEAPARHHDLFRKFADKTMEAIWHIARAYPSISLQQHVALIVPDEKFYSDFKLHVMKRLEEDFFPCHKVICFQDALRHISKGPNREVGKDAFILDWDENARGLEKLVVVAIGFDTRIDGDSANITRCRLYHVVTRAQLQAVVVDKLVRGGWLEFLSTLEHKQGTSFEDSTAEIEVRKGAAREVLRGAKALPDEAVPDEDMMSIPSDWRELIMRLRDGSCDEPAQPASRNLHQEEERAQGENSDLDTEIQEAAQGSAVIQTFDRVLDDGATEGKRMRQTALWDTSGNDKIQTKIDALAFDPHTLEVANCNIFDAVQRGLTPVVRQLLRAEPGAVHELHDRGWTALQVAARHNHTEICRELLNRGAAVDAQNSDGWTALRVAARHNHTEICRELLNRGAAVDAQNSDGWTALHLAARYGHAEICDLLVAASADTKERNSGGLTPLHLAASANNVEALQRLLAAKANAALKTVNGKTPLDMARERGHQEIVKIFEGSARSRRQQVVRQQVVRPPSQVRELVDPESIWSFF